MFSGLYINLDRRPDRRAHMEAEFARLGLAGRYARLRAIADAKPETGCFRSHLKALDEARRMGGIVHILEDDSILSAEFARFMESDALPALLERYDILFFDMWIDPFDEVVARYQAAIDSGSAVLPLDGSLRIAAMSSYVVAPRSFGKVRKLWRRHLDDGKPVDTVTDGLVKEGALTAALTVPFLTGVDIDSGTASDVSILTPASQERLVKLRTRFFVDRNRQAFI